MDKLIAAIRRHPLIGQGSNSTIDEAMDDAELAELLRELGVSDAETAIQKMLNIEMAAISRRLDSYGRPPEALMRRYKALEKAWKEVGGR